MQSTPIMGLPWFQLTDVPNAETLSRQLAEAIDTQGIPRFATATARDAAITAPVAGMRCYVTGRGGMEYTGSRWMERDPRRVRKTNNQDVSGTTLTGATDLTLTLFASTQYKFTMSAFAYGNSASDMTCRLAFTTSVASAFLGVHSLFDNPGGLVAGDLSVYAHYDAVVTATPSLYVKLDDTDWGMLTYRGVIRTDITDTVVTFEYAQFAAAGGTVQLGLDSYFEVEEF